MLDFLKPNAAIALLKDDHDRVKELFDRFEAAKGRGGEDEDRPEGVD